VAGPLHFEKMALGNDVSDYHHSSLFMQVITMLTCPPRTLPSNHALPCSCLRTQKVAYQKILILIYICIIFVLG